MTRHEALSSRPSLLSADHAPQAAVASGRILADMENRKEPRVRVPVATRRMRPGLAVIGLGLALLTGISWMAGSGSPAGTTPLASERPPISGEGRTPAAPAAPAVIVDAPQSRAATAPSEAGSPVGSSKPMDASPFAAVSREAQDSPFDAPSSEPPRAARGSSAARALSTATAKPVPVAAAKPVDSSQRSRAAATRTPAEAQRDTELLATLLRNIERAEAAPVRTGSTRTPMDDLVLKLENREKLAQSDTSVQSLLSRCPKANTPQGLLCRQKVCARFAGADPACPLPQ